MFSESNIYNRMKTGLLIFVIAIMLLNASALAEDDIVMQAISDELARSMTDLKLEDNAPPYYMQFLLNQEYNTRITAEYGSVIVCNDDKADQMFLDLRIGDYAFDNSNCMSGFRGFGMSLANLPRDEDYSMIRKSAWLQIDAAYKRAIEGLAMKKAILQTRIQEDTIADLAKVEKQINIQDKYEPQIDTVEWKKKLSKMSAIFKDYQQFDRSSVQLFAKTENRYVINSDGTRTRRGRHVHFLVLTARADDKNGMPVYEYDRIVVDDIADFPGEKELIQWVKDFAGNMAEMVEAETIEDYIGPVLFTANGANQLFVQLFVSNVSDPRKPLTADSRYDSYIPTAKLVRKKGFRVVPEFVSIIDDPTISNYKGVKLLGHYDYDDEGVPAQKINLVENGKLRNYYMSKRPTKKLEASNGHGRLISGLFGSTLIVGKPGNVIIESKETYTFEELKAQMLDLCREMDIEYGLIIDRMDFSGERDPDVVTYYGAGGDQVLPAVLTAYKVSVKDGSLTPVRGMNFENVSERVLKDILAVGNDYSVFHMMFDRSFNNLASMVTPSVLIEEMELTESSAQPRKPAIVLNPLKREKK
jgi:TldD protein